MDPWVCGSDAGDQGDGGPEKGEAREGVVSTDSRDIS